MNDEGFGCSAPGCPHWVDLPFLCEKCHDVTYCSHECMLGDRVRHIPQCRTHRRMVRRRASSGCVQDIVRREIQTNARFVEQLRARAGDGVLVWREASRQAMQDRIFEANCVLSPEWFVPLAPLPADNAELRVAVESRLGTVVAIEVGETFHWFVLPPSSSSSR